MPNSTTRFWRFFLLLPLLPPLFLAGCKSMEFSKVIDFPQPETDKEMTTAWFNLETLVSLKDGGFMMGVNSPYRTRGEPFNKENERMILMRFNKKGKLLWAKRYDCGLAGAGGSSRCLRQTQDGGFIIAADRRPTKEPRTACIIKTDGNGTVEWSRLIGDRENHMLANDIAFPPEGGYLLTGQLDERWGDICYIKLDESGAMEWNSVYDAEIGEDEGFYTEPTADGGYVSFCKVSRQPEIEHWMPREAPPPYMPRGVILKMDSRCNKQSEIQFYHFPILEKSSMHLITLSNGDYIVASENRFVRISPDGREIWYVSSNRGDIVGNEAKIAENKCIFFGEHSTLISIDVLGNVLHDKLSVSYRRVANSASSFFDSSIVYAWQIPEGRMTGTDIRIRFVREKTNKGEWANIKGKIGRQDSLFYGGYKLPPPRTAGIAEKPAQINEEKITLNIKKYPKQEP